MITMPQQHLLCGTSGFLLSILTLPPTEDMVHALMLGMISGIGGVIISVIYNKLKKKKNADNN